MAEQTRPENGEQNLEDEVNTELDRIGQGGRWVWYAIKILNFFRLHYMILKTSLKLKVFIDIPTYIFKICQQSI